ncbi:MAG: SEC-C metal-binding domain-containing protein [Vicinamibacterales bacterium]
MSRHSKPGRNDLCPCGSGKKRKHCCEAKAATQPWSWSARIFALLAVAAVVGAVAAGIFSYGESSSMTPMAGKVWSPEHGHYH